MKIFNRVQVLEEGELFLRFNHVAAEAIAIQCNATLHGFVLLPTNESRNGSKAPGLQPSLSIVMSPLAAPSWSNMIRMSVTVDPIPGALSRVLSNLNKNSLYCRHMESTNGNDLNEFQVFHSSMQSRVNHRRKKNQLDLIIPSTLLWLELPSKVPEVSSKETLRLHELLRKMVKDPQSDQDSPRQILQKLLQKDLENNSGTSRRDKISVSVDWISPLVTLNRLGRLSNYGGSKAPEIAPEDDDKNILAWQIRARARKKFLVEQDNDGEHRLNILPWASLIWKKRETIPDILTYMPKKWAVALCHADSDEQVICWDIFHQRNAILVAFELLIPTSGFEGEWWGWTLERISGAGGNVLTATTSAKKDGQWGSLELVVLFPHNESQADGRVGDIAIFLQCFKELQGKEGKAPAFATFRERIEEKLPKISRELSGPARKSRGIEPRFESTLHIHRVWDPDFDKDIRAYASRFAPNPFSFTKPLDQQSYLNLYGPSKLYTTFDKNLDGNTSSKQNSNATRSRLADRIAQRLYQKENIAIVGAHRSGKTTVLNLVRDRLHSINQELNQCGHSTTAESLGLGFEPEETIVVDVHAATTPPYAILPHVARKLHEWAHQHKDPNHELPTIVKDQLRVGFADSIMRALFHTIKREIGLQGESASTSEFNENLSNFLTGEPWESFADLIWVLGEISPEQGTAFLKKSLNSIRQTITAVADAGKKISVIVLIDEVGILSGWGHDVVLQAWRHAIESSDFSRIRWVISTSRPIAGSPELSPITNVFKEHNVGSLASDECEKLLDSFSWGPTDDSAPNILHPTMSFLTRGTLRLLTSGLPYLLQVCLYHIFDRATRVKIPLVNRKICEEIIADYVIPEISDYLESQWREVPGTVRSQIYEVLSCCDNDPATFLRDLPSETLSQDQFPSSIRKILKRSGLKGDDNLILSPIVALWLITVDFNRREEERSEVTSSHVPVQM